MGNTAVRSWASADVGVAVERANGGRGGGWSERLDRPVPRFEWSGTVVKHDVQHATVARNPGR